VHDRICRFLFEHTARSGSTGRNDAQRSTTMKRNLLWSSGGALELPKCSCHHLHDNFTPNGSPVLQQGCVGPKLVTCKARETLGRCKFPSGGEVKQIKTLRKQSNLPALQAETANMTCQEAWTFYFAICLTSVGYPLPNCHTQWKDLDNVQRPAINTTPSKCGFNQNMHRSTVWGPNLCNGADFRHLCTAEGEGGATSLTRNIRHGGNVG
jgi:hypothetical protein